MSQNREAKLEQIKKKQCIFSTGNIVRDPVEQKKLQSLDKGKRSFSKSLSQQKLDFDEWEHCLQWQKMKTNLVCPFLPYSCWHCLHEKSDSSKALKVFHLKNLQELFSDFNFEDNEDLFLDASQETSRNLHQ